MSSPMEKVLLGDAFDVFCAFGQAVGIHFAHYPANPDVNGKSVNSSATVKQGAFSNLCTYTFDFYKFFACFVNITAGKFLKINFAVCNLLCSIDYVFCSEA